MKVAPSILAADPLNMERDVQRMVDAGTDWLHVDIMDAHFVPNLSFSPALTKALHERFPMLPLDVHLMMDEPEKYIDASITHSSKLFLSPLHSVNLLCFGMSPSSWPSWMCFVTSLWVLTGVYASF